MKLRPASTERSAQSTSPRKNRTTQQLYVKHSNSMKDETEVNLPSLLQQDLKDTSSKFRTTINGIYRKNSTDVQDLLAINLILFITMIGSDKYV